MSKTRPRVVWWSNMPTPYFVDRLNAVARRGNIDLEVWFNVERESDRSWRIDPNTWLFRARYIPMRRFGFLSMPIPVLELQATQPDVFVQEYFWAFLAAGSLVAKRFASRTTFRVLPNFDAWSQRTWWRELSKNFLFRTIDGAKVPGLDGAKLALRYGLPADRLCVVTQSIDTDHFSAAREVAQDVRTRRRHDLGLKGCVFIYVGRLWAGKGLDYLFEAYQLAKLRDSQMSLLILGDGRDEQRYRALAQSMTDIRFVGFIQKSELPQYYALADVMVFPTLGDPNGLVVEEAMASGLPVICTDAAGDIHQRLPDGEVGYIVPSADATSLAERMIMLAGDAVLRQRLSARAPMLVAAKTHERYAIDFEHFIASVLAMPPRRTLAAHIAWVMGELLRLVASPNGKRPVDYLRTAYEGSNPKS